MKLPRILILMAFLALSASASFATLRTVNQFGTAQYATITAAYVAAVDGDTIIIEPGTYNEGFTSNKRLIWIGAGWDLTRITGSNQSYFNTAGASRSSVEGIRFDVTSVSPLRVIGNADSCIIRRCILRTNAATVLDVNSSGRVYVEDCILQCTSNQTLVGPSSNANGAIVFRNCVFSMSNQPTAAINGNNAATLEFYNCVFLNNRQIFNLTGTQPVIAINNVFADWHTSPSFGTFLAGSSFDYNASDNTGPAFPGSFTNSISLGANNPFLNYNYAGIFVADTSDLHLSGAGGTQLTDTGNPLLLDLDASRSDLGVYGGYRPLVVNGVPAFPFVTTLSLPTLVGVGDSVTVNSSGRVGPRY